MYLSWYGSLEATDLEDFAAHFEEDIRRHPDLFLSDLPSRIVLFGDEQPPKKNNWPVLLIRPYHNNNGRNITYVVGSGKTGFGDDVQFILGATRYRRDKLNLVLWESYEDKRIAKQFVAWLEPRWENAARGNMFDQRGMFQWWTRLNNTSIEYFKEALMLDLPFEYGKTVGRNIFELKTTNILSIFSSQWFTKAEDEEFLAVCLDAKMNGPNTVFVQIGRNVPISTLIPARIMTDEEFLNRVSFSGRVMFNGKLIFIPWSENDARVVIHGKKLTEWLHKWLTRRWGAVIEANIPLDQMEKIEEQLLCMPLQNDISERDEVNKAEQDTAMSNVSPHAHQPLPKVGETLPPLPSGKNGNYSTQDWINIFQPIEQAKIVHPSYTEIALRMKRQPRYVQKLWNEYLNREGRFQGC